MRAWFGLAAAVAAIDYLFPKTLTREFQEQARTHPVLATLGVAYVLSHLYAVLPRKLDLFYGFAAVTQIPLRNRSNNCLQEVSYDEYR